MVWKKRSNNHHHLRSAGAAVEERSTASTNPISSSSTTMNTRITKELSCSTVISTTSSDIDNDNSNSNRAKNAKLAVANHTIAGKNDDGDDDDRSSCSSSSSSSSGSSSSSSSFSSRSSGTGSLNGDPKNNRNRRTTTSSSAGDNKNNLNPATTNANNISNSSNTTSPRATAVATEANIPNAITTIDRSASDSKIAVNSPGSKGRGEHSYYNSALNWKSLRASKNVFHFVPMASPTTSPASPNKKKKKFLPSPTKKKSVPPKNKNEHLHPQQQQQPSSSPKASPKHAKRDNNDGNSNYKQSLYTRLTNKLGKKKLLLDEDYDNDDDNIDEEKKDETHEKLAVEPATATSPPPVENSEEIDYISDSDSDFEEIQQEANKLIDASNTIQGVVRAFLTRCHYQQKRKALIKIQAHIRGFVQYTIYQNHLKQFKDKFVDIDRTKEMELYMIDQMKRDKIQYFLESIDYTKTLDDDDDNHSTSSASTTATRKAAMQEAKVVRSDNIWLRHDIKKIQANLEEEQKIYEDYNKRKFAKKRRIADARELIRVLGQKQVHLQQSLYELQQEIHQSRIALTEMEQCIQFETRLKQETREKIQNIFTMVDRRCKGTIDSRLPILLKIKIKILSSNANTSATASTQITRRE